MKITIKYKEYKSEGYMLDLYAPLRNLSKEGNIPLNLTVHKKLNFSLDYPVTIDALESYDGSVNLLITDNYNKPRLINTRFALKGKDEFLISNRSGTNDTNVYSLESFDSDTSLFKTFSTNASVSLKSIKEGGNLKVGNYIFYFKYTDLDGNDSNIFAQSGICSCFLGNNNKINGGYANYNSKKYITLELNNLDTSFDYIKVYYTRASSDLFSLTNTTVHELLLPIPIFSDTCVLTITGDEEELLVTDFVLNILNLNLLNYKSLAQINNQLFVANTNLNNIPYEELKDLALRVYPVFSYDDKDYVTNTVENIYNRKGYMPDEFYRFGIVFVYEDNTETNAFNIRGIISSKDGYTPKIEESNKKIPYNETTGYIKYDDTSIENIYGVSYTGAKIAGETLKVQFKFPNDPEFYEKLRSFGIVNYYIVRQKRLPTILTLIYTSTVSEKRGIQGIRLNDKTWYPTFSYTKHDDEAHQMITAVEDKYISNRYLTAFCPDYDINPARFHNLFVGERFPIKKIGKFSTYKSTLYHSDYTEDILYMLDGNITDVDILYVEENTKSVGLNKKVFRTRLGEETELIRFEHIYGNNLQLKETIGNISNNNYDAPEVPYYQLILPDNSVVSNAMVTLQSHDTKDGIYKALYSYTNGISSGEFTITQPIHLRSKHRYFSLFSLLGDSELGYLLMMPRTREAIQRHLRNNPYKYYGYLPSVKLQELATLRKHYVIVAARALDLVGLMAESFFAGINPSIYTTYSETRIDVNDITFEGIKSLRLNVEKTKNLVVTRGIYGKHLALDLQLAGNNSNFVDSICNVYIPNFKPISLGSVLDVDTMRNVIDVRLGDNSPFMRIQDTCDLNTSNFPVYYGDCNICNFTHRVYRNFLDAVAPNSDTIVKTDSPGYGAVLSDLHNKSELAKKFVTHNRGDYNSVKLGYWVTMRVRSHHNLNIRSVDDTYPSEYAITGNYRAFFPYRDIDVSGNNKIPESNFINEGFSLSLGSVKKLIYKTTPSNKSIYTNRIYYSNVCVKDSFLNGYRIIRSNHFKDYTLQYGAITKILPMLDSLLVVFSHGIALIRVAPLQLRTTEYINTNSLLPDDLTLVISEDFGSIYADSILRTPYGVFGVDTLLKKIWKVTPEFNVISEMKINSFLAKHLKSTIRDRENIVTLNCKTVYNSLNGNVIFTFYSEDNSELFSISYNEKLGLGIWNTFYSWIPLFGENINNTFITFDRLRSYDIYNRKDTNLVNYIWNHNSKSIFNYLETLLPTYWYNELHPFEFGFTVNDNIAYHKIFSNLVIIGNNSAPESFHYSFTGDCYKFANFKKEMYFRLEALKAFYNKNGADIMYDKDLLSEGLQLNNIEYWDIGRDPNYKVSNGTFLYLTTILPMKYYRRSDTRNKIYDSYTKYTESNKDFSNIAGAEVIRIGKEFGIQSHAPAIPIQTSVLRGNMNYREDKWYVLINSIPVIYDNESTLYWVMNDTTKGKYMPSIYILNIPVTPELYLKSGELLIPDVLQRFGYTTNNVDNSKVFEPATLYNRGEIQVKDKIVRIKIRYNGTKFTKVHAVNTIYQPVS